MYELKSPIDGSVVPIQSYEEKKLLGHRPDRQTEWDVKYTFAFKSLLPTGRSDVLNEAAALTSI